MNLADANTSGKAVAKSFRSLHVPDTWRRFLTGLCLVLALGTGIGWLYGHALWGFTAACMLSLAWQVRQLLRFEQAVRTRNFDHFRVGEGIWPQIFSHFSHLRQRNRRRKREYLQLLKEVRNMTNALPDGGIVLNAWNEILLCNAAAQRLAGFDARQDRGQRVDNILRAPKFIKYLKSGEYEKSIEIPSPLREGVWLQCKIVAYGADQRLLLIRDVTERRRLATMRREFVANASHELRSPLTVISGYLDTLAEDPEVPQHWQKPLCQMRDQAVRMNTILNSLLELSRLESAGSASEEKQVDVVALLESLANIHGGENAMPAIRVHAESRQKLLGSAAEIESVIRNLLSNAVRHTPPDGSIDMTWRSGPDGGELVVADSGEGIAREFIPRITERFFRIDQGRSREDGGVGLGLAIVKHVLSRHDAKLEIESTLGEGSRFICRFPPERLVMAAVLPAQATAHSVHT
ncbi:MAG TPA: phosphate regulon sensor histidine kinase PhoR [Woeseiaceae bacterium]|nr:phosphate regulon sensor histidine kinase PhoR [Woeseiaceae bacterium]